MILNHADEVDVWKKCRVKQKNAGRELRFRSCGKPGGFAMPALRLGSWFGGWLLIVVTIGKLNAQITLFDITNLSGTTTSINGTASGLSATPLLSRNGLTSTSGLATFVSTNNLITQNMPDFSQKYIGFAVTPSAGNVLFTSGLSFGVSASSMAPNQFAAAYSTDNFVTSNSTIGSVTTSAVAQSFNFNLITNDTLSVRIQNFGTTSLGDTLGPAGSFHITSNVTVNGSTLPASSGAISLTAATEIRNSGALGLGRNIYGAQSITKTGAGTLTFSGANFYTGTTTINAGNLTISGGMAIANTGTVILANTSGVGFNVNSSETIASLQGGGSMGGIVTIASGQTLTVVENGNQTFAGSLQGAGNFFKTGGGEITLNGINTCTGDTTVSGGKLVLGSAGSIASGSLLRIASVSTFDVKAKTSGFTLGNALMIDVGAASAGKLDATGVALTLSGNLTLNITTATPLSSYNLFTFGSETGAFSNINLSGSFSGGMTGSSGVWTASSNGYDFTFTESTGVLQATTATIPEPGTWVLLVIGATFLLYRIRRKNSSSSGQN